MTQDTARPHIAAFIIFRREGKVAFVLRQHTGWMDGHYGLPAGKIEHDESFIAGAIREAREETGVDLQPKNLEHVLTAHRTGETDGLTWIDIVFEAHDWSGEPRNAEPHKHGALDWLDPAALPDNVIPVGRFYLEQIAAGHHYAEYGWPV